MKKAAAISLLLIYFTTTTGFVAYQHYCMNRLQAVELLPDDSDNCGQCKMPKKDNGCCHDEYVVWKLNVHHLLVKAFLYETSLLAAQALMPSVLQASFYNFKQTGFIPSHSPPLPTNVALHVQHCVFRI